ncbi:MAG: circularly permuted type 2 ATP-grasp protein [Sulfuricurvum sp.]|uniref:circularly permuted type 2 ATP-grasp protein n=1 Tax=Sulfuricurvum sp. TaxID=2025608 RepID=UPI0025F01446|nr:circularly permuted type 2 ATP-grasp protein [Sulfuricurvum sp.]MBV5321466.1 circularly permuted type 2 ATP-grasp protein [Sulfuricurvum sp.]
MFERYAQNSTYDEMFDQDKNIRPHWEKLRANLEQIGLEQLHTKQKEIDWRLEDNGVTYNVYNDPGGLNRPWKLDPIPLIIEEEQWNVVEEGLKQRCKLFNLLLQDIYGEQKTISDGIIPMEIIYAHGGFMREMHGMKMPLTIYAADMARGPDGKLWVINDRTQAPSGLGYAIENRLTMNATMRDLFEGISVQRLYDFFETFKSLFQSNSRNFDPLNVLLSPGPHNETYFEHAYLSSFLGLTLVQGQDLLAKNGAVWLKSLKGLRRVDTILRRVDESYCDPLELRGDSQLGVAGLVQSIRSGGVEMLNPLGSGVLENLGLNPFMSHLARYFLDEELILPQIATWWCGQAKEQEFVLDNLERLIIKTIDRIGEKHTYVGKHLSKKELKTLRQEILAQPHRYVGQEEVEFASCPTLIQEQIEPRRAVIRAYTIAQDNTYTLMPGALVRVGMNNDSLMVSNQFGGSSKDLWVLGESESIPLAPQFKTKTAVEHSLENIPSLRAENLFWLGRYLMRSIITARMIRTTLKYMTNASRYDHISARQTQEMLTKALTHVTMTYPGFLEEDSSLSAFDEIASVSFSAARVGSLAQIITMLSGANTYAKSILPLEASRIYERLEREWNQFCSEEKPSPRFMIHNLDKLLMPLMAYKELIQESLFADQGSVLYEIGARLERSQLLISKVRALLIPVHDVISEYEILETLLSTCESLNAYRARYRSSYEMRNIIEFLLLDINFPKSLISEIEGLLKILPQLPKFKNAIYLSRYEEPIFEAFSMIRLSKLDTLCGLAGDEYVRSELDILLSSLSERLLIASSELSKTYFAHYDE